MMKFWIHIIALIFVFAALVLRTRRLDRRSITILIVLLSILIYENTARFGNFSQKDPPKNFTSTWKFEEPTEQIQIQLRKIPITKLSLFGKKKYVKKEKSTPASSSPWDFDEYDKKQMNKQYMLWLVWLQNHMKIGLPYIKNFLKIVQKQNMSITRFCKAIAELHTIVDKLIERVQQLDFSRNDELLEFLDRPKFVKCCKILQKTSGMSWYKEKIDEDGILEHDEGAMWVCNEFLKKIEDFKNE